MLAPAGGWNGDVIDDNHFAEAKGYAYVCKDEAESTVLFKVGDAPLRAQMPLGDQQTPVQRVGERWLSDPLSTCGGCYTWSAGLMTPLGPRLNIWV